MNTELKSYAKTIKTWLKTNNFNHASVKISGNVMIIDNLGLNDAATIASIATGNSRFFYMTQSMTKLA